MSDMAFPPTPEGQARWDELDKLAEYALRRVYEPCHRGSCAGQGEPCEPHPCPYAQEIHDDHSTLCNCCEACQRERGEDV